MRQREEHLGPIIPLLEILNQPICEESQKNCLVQRKSFVRICRKQGFAFYSMNLFWGYWIVLWILLVSVVFGFKFLEQFKYVVVAGWELLIWRI